MKDFINYEKLEELSKGESDLGAEYKVIKLMEESGELAQAFLRLSQSKNVSASANGDDPTTDFLEEACDVLNVTIDMINNITEANPLYENVVRELFEVKLNKWESKQKIYKD